MRLLYHIHFLLLLLALHVDTLLASQDEDEISRQGHFFAYPRQALAGRTELQNLPRYFFNNAELKKARENPQEATFERMTKSLAKNQDGILFQRLMKRSNPDDEIFERLTKRGNADDDEEVFQRLTKKNNEDQFQRLTKKNFDDQFQRLTRENNHDQFQRLTKKNNDDQFQRLTKKNDHDQFQRLTKKNNLDAFSHYILYSYHLPLQNMKYGLRPWTNVGLL